MNYSRELKIKLASDLADIDAQNFLCSYDEAFIHHLTSESFDLLQYWLDYFGVFDGGQDLLILLKPNK